MVLAALLLVQAALGIASQIVLVDARPHHATALQVLVPSTHQVVGALMIATTTLLAARAWRRLRAPAGAVVGASGRAAA
jgi:hypothetical protein